MPPLFYTPSSPHTLGPPPAPPGGARALKTHNHHRLGWSHVNTIKNTTPREIRFFFLEAVLTRGGALAPRDRPCLPPHSPLARLCFCQVLARDRASGKQARRRGGTRRAGFSGRVPLFPKTPTSSSFDKKPIVHTPPLNTPLTFFFECFDFRRYHQNNKHHPSTTHTIPPRRSFFYLARFSTHTTPTQDHNTRFRFNTSTKHYSIRTPPLFLSCALPVDSPPQPTPFFYLAPRSRAPPRPAFVARMRERE